MCGRFAIDIQKDEIITLFNVQKIAREPIPNYNIAPTQDVPVIVEREGVVTLDAYRWGFIPSWASDKKISSSLINARAETLGQKMSFKNSFHHQRCIIVASGFYEWKKTESEKKPYFIHPKKGFFAFAGLWNEWKSIKSCTIITVPANAVVSEFHERMPAILEPSQFHVWLNPLTSESALSNGLLSAYPASQTAVYPVSKAVNSVKINSPECIIEERKKL